MERPERGWRMLMPWEKTDVARAARMRKVFITSYDKGR